MAKLLRPAGLLLAVMLSVSLVSCGQQPNANPPSITDSSHVRSSTPSSYSEQQADQTEIAANAAATDGELFRKDDPKLGGLTFGSTSREVHERHGVPDDIYMLPADLALVDIWEYDGLSVGFLDGSVVYIEVASSKVNTGITGLRTGISGVDAAQLLHIADSQTAHVMTVDVDNGWLKLDLDAQTNEVLSIKLISDLI